MIAIYFHLVLAQIRGQMSYKKSFLLEIAAYVIGNSMDLFAIYFLFLHFPTVKGWSMPEVFYLYGLASVSYASAQLFAESFEKVPELIRTGEFDQVLTRPLPPILQVMPLSFRISRVGRLLQGLFGFMLAFHSLELPWGSAEIILFAISILSAITIYFGLFLGNAALCFWTTQSTEIFNAFTYGGVELSKYPITIYRSWLKNLFLYIIPVGFVSYFPSVVLLGKEDPLHMPVYFAYLSPLVALVFFVSMWSCWRLGIHHYQSTGS